jgi:hypothetical protein
MTNACDDWPHRSDQHVFHSVTADAITQAGLPNCGNRNRYQLSQAHLNWYVVLRMRIELSQLGRTHRAATR